MGADGSSGKDGAPGLDGKDGGDGVAKLAAQSAKPSQSVTLTNERTEIVSLTFTVTNPGPVAILANVEVENQGTGANQVRCELLGVTSETAFASLSGFGVSVIPLSSVVDLPAGEHTATVVARKSAASSVTVNQDRARLTVLSAG